MDQMPTQSLAKMLSENKEVFFNELNNVINPTFKGLSQPSNYINSVSLLIRNLSRPAFPRQARLIAAAQQHLKTEKSLIISSEMGTGKTLVGLSIALEAKYKVNFIMSPPHLVSKWADEIRISYNDKVKYKIVIVARWEDLVPYTKRDLRREGVKYFFIVSRESAKLSYKRVHAFTTKTSYVWKEQELDGEMLTYKEKVTTPTCPRCGNAVMQEEVEGKRAKPFPYKCPHETLDADDNVISTCGEVLRDVDRDVSDKMRTRISVAEYVKRQWKKGSIDLLLVDEIHEYKGGDTGQGNALAMMCTRARNVVGLTGTLLNGYASSLFYILYRLNPALMKERIGLDYNQVKQFVQIYGAHEEIVEATETNSEGIVTKKGRRIALKEKPKISPFLLSLILDMTIFLRLDEIKMESDLRLPSYTESIETVEMDEEYKSAYKNYIADISAQIRKDKRFLGNLAMDSLSVCDLPFMNHSAHDRCFYRPRVIRDESFREDDEQIVLPLTSKEIRLIELVEGEMKNGRNTLIYNHFSNKGVGDDLERILTEAFPNKVVRLLKANIPARKRQKWIEDNPCDILICNPELVKTGLDLLQFPTIIYYEIGYNVFTLKQASRRSWRIGQRVAVKVIFMAYANSPQQKALELVGAKVNAANSLEGRLSGEDDLSSLGDDDDNIQLALAKAILSGDMGSVTDIEMTSIEAFGDREWDSFELYYREMLASHLNNEDLELLDEKVIPIDVDFVEPVSEKEAHIDVVPIINDSELIQTGFNFENEDTQPKIIAYKRVRNKSGKGYREIRMEMTKADIDKQIELATSEDVSHSIQLSLF